MTHHMSLKNLRDYSVTFDENNCTVKYYAKIKKMLIKLKSKTFSSEGHGFMIGADFDTFLGTITGNFRGSKKLFHFLGS